MFVSAPKSHKINILSNSMPQIKKRLNLHFDSGFVSCSYESEFHGHFEFFFFQIYWSVTFIPNPLCYHKYVILSSTCLAVIVTVNTSKNGGCLGFKVKKSFLSKDTRKKIKNKFCRNHKLSFHVRQTIINMGCSHHFGCHFVFC